MWFKRCKPESRMLVCLCLCPSDEQGVTLLLQYKAPGTGSSTGATFSSGLSVGCFPKADVKLIPRICETFHLLIWLPSIVNQTMPVWQYPGSKPSVASELKFRWMKIKSFLSVSSTRSFEVLFVDSATDGNNLGWSAPMLWTGNSFACPVNVPVQTCAANMFGCVVEWVKSYFTKQYLLISLLHFPLLCRYSWGVANR